jgi:hypothetical protein
MKTAHWTPTNKNKHNTWDSVDRVTGADARWRGWQRNTAPKDDFCVAVFPLICVVKIHMDSSDFQLLFTLKLNLRKSVAKVTDNESFNKQCKQIRQGQEPAQLSCNNTFPPFNGTNFRN